MKVNRSSLFWGILLIAGGGLALAQQMGYLDELPDSVWMWIFGFVSLVAFLSYALSGWKDWGWLFPAGVFGGLAVIVGLAVSGYENAAIGSPLFFGLLIPFVAAYLTNRANNWWALIPGGVMLFLALVTLLPLPLIAAAVPAPAAVPAAGIRSRNRDRTIASETVAGPPRPDRPGVSETRPFVAPTSRRRWSNPLRFTTIADETSALQHAAAGIGNPRGRCSCRCPGRCRCRRSPSIPTKSSSPRSAPMPVSATTAIATRCRRPWSARSGAWAS